MITSNNDQWLLSKRIFKLKRELNEIPINTPAFNKLYKTIGNISKWRTELKADQFVESLNERIGTIDMIQDIKALPTEGEDEGDLCNRDGCIGIIEEQEEPDGGCSCHIVAPCGFCELRGLTYCPECDWEMERP